jgi:hypothetical protein
MSIQHTLCLCAAVCMGMYVQDHVSYVCDGIFMSLLSACGAVYMRMYGDYCVCVRTYICICTCLKNDFCTAHAMRVCICVCMCIYAYVCDGIFMSVKQTMCLAAVCMRIYT